uniref:Uncharacterized protein n=1 Tax=Trichuris muris TaxID=70415 RepID=A0A5S6QDR8_TRIMR
MSGVTTQEATSFNINKQIESYWLKSQFRNRVLLLSYCWANRTGAVRIAVADSHSAGQRWYQTRPENFDLTPRIQFRDAGSKEWLAAHLAISKEWCRSSFDSKSSRQSALRSIIAGADSSQHPRDKQFTSPACKQQLVLLNSRKKVCSEALGLMRLPARCRRPE